MRTSTGSPAPSPDHVLLSPSTTGTVGPSVTAALGGRTPDQLRETAVAVAAAAAAHVRDARRRAAGEDGRVPVAATKSSAVDPVTAVDRSSESLIRGMLSRLAPQDAVLGEEDGGALRPGTVTWVVDPVDGTVNFIYGFPASAVSVAATVDGVPVAGAVADIARHRVFSACTGGPAQVGGEDAGVAGAVGTAGTAGAAGEAGGARRIGPPPELTDLGGALVATGFSYDAGRRAAQADLLCGLLPRIRDIRRAGSAALDLCAVAAGAVDAYYEHGLGPWDHAAGALIAARAGAQVAMPRLTAGYADGVGVLAASPGISAELAGHVLSRTMPEE